MENVILSIYVETKYLDNVTGALRRIPEITDLFEVTGDFDVVCLIKVQNMREFRRLLKEKILTIKGVRGTNSTVILHVHKRNGVLVEE